MDFISFISGIFIGYILFLCTIELRVGGYVYYDTIVSQAIHDYRLDKKLKNEEPEVDYKDVRDLSNIVLDFKSWRIKDMFYLESKYNLIMPYIYNKRVD